MKVLGIESSCDETGVALVEIDGARGPRLLADALYSQAEMHQAFGGVVPELASRDHIRRVVPLLRQVLDVAGCTLQQLDLVAYTRGPGLAGALLVGAGVACSLAAALGKPVVGVHHLEGHLLSPFLSRDPPDFPFVALLVSGGHTQLMRVEGVGRYELLGETIDDAAGEAFDKVARFLDLGYPGGPAIDAAALAGDPEAIRFPRAMMDDGYDFSFSGLKTSVMNYVRKHPDVSSEDVAASFQAAVVDVLVTKASRAAALVGATGIVLGGGVAANSLLREQVLDACGRAGIQGFLPSRAMCTDNAAMIAAAGWHRLRSDGPTSLDVGATPNLRLPFID
jgi:N6-L-threonylcarbamoyladenine synthase